MINKNELEFTQCLRFEMYNKNKKSLIADINLINNVIIFRAYIYLTNKNTILREFSGENALDQAIEFLNGNKALSECEEAEFDLYKLLKKKFEKYESKMFY